MNLIQILMTPNVVINNILICIFGFLEIFLYEKFFTNLLNMYQTIPCASTKLVKMYNPRTTACNADYVFYI
jgi:hypothetical protein